MPQGSPWALRQSPGHKTEKRDFPGLGALFGGETGRPKSFSRKSRYIFTFCVLTDRTLRGGKSQNTWFSGPFGLGQPLGTKRNSGPKTEKRDFPELGALLGGETGRPKSFSRKLRNFFTFGVLTDPQRREIAKYLVFRPFWPGAAPGH